MKPEHLRPLSRRERADSRQRRDQRTSYRDTEEQARGEDQIQIVEYSAHAACKRECCAGKQQHRAIAETIDQPSDDGRTESERSEENKSELQSLMRISYAVF